MNSKLSPVSAKNATASRCKLLKQTRKSMKLTQANIADMLNVTSDKISAWESGKIKTIPPDILKGWCQILNLEPHLLEFSVPPALDYDASRSHLVIACTDFLSYVSEHYEDEKLFKTKNDPRKVKYDLFFLLNSFLNLRYPEN